MLYKREWLVFTSRICSERPPRRRLYHPGAEQDEDRSVLARLGARGRSQVAGFGNKAADQ